MTLFRNKYRIESARLKGWDYSRNGAYFITVCTADRRCLFGKIVNGQMVLSDIGKIVEHEWNRSFEIRAELFCDAFVIMPNHIHAILRIDDGGNGIVDTHGSAYPVVGTHSRASLHGVAIRRPKSISSFMAGFKSVVTKRCRDAGLGVGRITNAQPCIGNIADARPDGNFKNARPDGNCDKNAQPNGHCDRDARPCVSKIWQPRFHDHIIRDENEFARIKQYIINNPRKWAQDKFSK